MRKLFVGGSDGNEQLTAMVATVLLVLLAAEAATLLNLGSLLTVHAFVGMLLIPVIVLKLAGTGWRMLRYYLRGDEYVRRTAAWAKRFRCEMNPAGTNGHSYSSCDVEAPVPPPSR